MKATTPQRSNAGAASRPAIPWWEIARAWLVARAMWLMVITAANATASFHTFGPFDRGQIDAGLTIWDGDFYLRIAEFGYGYTPRSALRFFPLYPMIGRLVSVDVGLPAGVMLPLLANVFAFAAMVLTYVYVIDRTGDADLARNTMWLLGIFPSAYTLILAYAEPLALTLGLGSLVLLARQRYAWATLAAVLAGASRPTAWLLSVIVIVDLLVERGLVPGSTVDRGPNGFGGTDHSASGVLAPLTVAIGPFVGTAAYLGWVGHRFGDWLEPIRIQSGLRAGWQDPFTRTIDLFRSLVSDPGNDAVNLAFLVVFVVAIVAGWNRLPRSWTALSIVTVIVAMSSANVDSIGRYGLLSVSLIAGCAVIAGRDRTDELSVFALSAGAFVALGVMTLIAGYVP